MKKVIKVILIVVIIALCWIVYRQFAAPMEFAAERKVRETAIVQRLKDIRSAQRAFKQVHQRYTTSFDTLISFVLVDSIIYDKAIGSEDDSVAMASGLVRMEQFKKAVKDTIYSGRNFTEKNVRELRIIPYSNNKEFIMDAGRLTTESTVEVSVFVAKAPYKTYLEDVDMQELINLVDEANAMEKYAGLKVGSLTEATNDAGNWE